MKNVRAAGAFPAAPFSLQFESGRAGLFACAGVLAALNAQIGHILNDITFQNSLAGLANLAGVSGVIWFAMYATLRTGFDVRETQVSKRDSLVLTAIITLSTIPVAAAAKVALELEAIYLLLSSGSDENVKRVGIILLGLTGPLVWGQLLLEAFAMPLLGLDAHLVAAVIGSPVHGNIVQFANSQRQFLIGIPCSSVHNISLALVLWTTAAALFQLRFDGRFIGCGLLMVVYMFCLNIARLSLIGLYPQSFSFLHDGAGADLFSWAALLGAGVIAFVGVGGAAARQK